MPELEPALASLTDAQVAQVLQHLFSHFDDSEVPAVTQDEIDARVGADRAFLGDLAAAAGPPPAAPEDGDVRALIAALAEAVPETRPAIDAAIDRAESERTLPIDHDTALSVLAIATSAAILRPKFTFRRTRKQDGDDLQIDLDIRGTQGMGRVLDIITRFLNP
ncbi:hypothetical protein [Actinomadura sp. NPDC048394]|jgi:hypothetical protein|uniref:hypothetical protein n=1 Tax=Actinomadura sp. NPDC048394 TaxID=3158223 RepID=UPI0033F1BB66